MQWPRQLTAVAGQGRWSLRTWTGVAHVPDRRAELDRGRIGRRGL